MFSRFCLFRTRSRRTKTNFSTLNCELRFETRLSKSIKRSACVRQLFCLRFNNVYLLNSRRLLLPTSQLCRLQHAIQSAATGYYPYSRSLAGEFSPRARPEGLPGQSLPGLVRAGKSRLSPRARFSKAAASQSFVRLTPESRLTDPDPRDNIVCLSISRTALAYQSGQASLSADLGFAERTAGVLRWREGRTGEARPKW